MTVFGTVTASLSPNLSTYIRFKGKAWRAAFIASLETMAGVEYTVYKKKGCWQIKGDWENVKHAYKILTKVTKADDWTRCLLESSQLQPDHGTNARLSTRPPRRGVAVGRQGAKRSHIRLRSSTTSFGDSNQLTDTTQEYQLDPHESSAGPTVHEGIMDTHFALGNIKTEPFERITTTESVENKVNIDGENALSSAIIDYAFELANERREYTEQMTVSETEKMHGSPEANSKTVINKSDAELNSTAEKSSGNEPQTLPPASEGYSSCTSMNLQSGQKSSGSRRKRGRPRKLDVSYSTMVNDKEVCLEDQPVDDTLEMEDSTEFPFFTDSDNNAEDSDPSDDQDLSIDKMVEDGKANIKGRSRRKSYTCSICQFSCTSQHGVTEHKKRQHAKKTLKCPICNKAYGVKRDLQKHIRRHTAQYKCEKCGKTYKEDRTYKNHMKTHEEDYVAPRFFCKQCPKSFTTPYVLQAHVEQVHNGKVLEYLCTTCGKKFKQKHSLAEHNLIHTGERPYACKICHKTFRHKGSCVNHELLHSDLRLFTCEICGKDFKHRNSLRIHAAVHDTNRNYECSICNKKFTQKQALIRHSRIHSGEKPFMCELCGDRFSDSSILRRHMMGIHKTEYKAGNNHFVLPADHFQGKPEGAMPGSTLKLSQPDNPTDVGTLTKDLKGQETTKQQQKGEQHASSIPPVAIPTSLSLEDYRVGHIASSMTSPYILQGALPYSLYPQTDRASNSYSNLLPGSHLSNVGMPLSRDIPFPDGSSSIKSGVTYHEQLLLPVTITGASASHHSGLQSTDKPHTLQPY